MSTNSADVGPAPRAAAGAPLSGRARTALLQLQRRVTEREREMKAADRVLSGALSAASVDTQTEMLETYLETVQELRVSLQRLEAFLISRVVPGRDGLDGSD
jgi:hypothetical protein